MENSLAVSQNVKYRVTIWPRNSIPGSIPERNENICPHRPLSLNVYRAAFTIVQKGRTAIYPSSDEWKSNMWCMHTMVYYSAKKKEKRKCWCMLQWRWTLKTVRWVKGARAKRPRIMRVPVYEMSRTGTSTERAHRANGCLGLGIGLKGVTGSDY